MTTTGAETLPQRPPPNRTIGTEMLPPPNMTTTGAETLPDQRLSQLTEAVVAGAGQVKLTKAELKKQKQN